MKIFLSNLFLVFLIIGCTTNKKTVNNNKETTISLGETISIDNFQVKFVKVLEDSRCPKEVTCIWAGRAKVLVEIFEKGKESLQKELIFGQLKQGETKDLTLFTTKEKKAVGITLKPYPSSENTVSEKEFQLLISVEKNEK